MSARYNEFEPFAAQWLRNLIAAGHIASGEVDARSIHDLTVEDLKGFAQFHTFAGIGIWSHALREAGWPDERPIWTGSCPCQPYSQAGRRLEAADPRNLWPEWFRLIRAGRPPVILGEQVANGGGLAWLDTVFADLEAAGYAVGAVDSSASGYGAPHIRQRLYFAAIRMADADSLTGGQGSTVRGGSHSRSDEEPRTRLGSGERAGWLAHDDGSRLGEFRSAGLLDGQRPALGNDSYRRGASVWVGNTDGEHAGRNTGASDREKATSERGRLLGGGSRDGALTPSSVGGVGDTNDARLERYRRPVDLDDSQGRSGEGRHRPTAGFWSHAEWIHCRDEKWRPVEPGTFPLAHGVAGRVAALRPGAKPEATNPEEVHWYNRAGALRGLGNAIVGPQAVEFCKAVIDFMKSAGLW